MYTNFINSCKRTISFHVKDEFYTEVTIDGKTIVLTPEKLEQVIEELKNCEKRMLKLEKLNYESRYEL